MVILTKANKYDFYWSVLLLGADFVVKSTFCKRITNYNNYNEFMEINKKKIFFLLLALIML